MVLIAIGRVGIVFCTKMSEKLVDSPHKHCIFNYTMANELSITQMLQKCINESGIPFLTLEQETGVLRQSLMKFARGERTIRLDAADKLARYYGLELRPAPKAKGK